MTIAVTPFTGLCGFRPLGEIAHFISNVPPLAKLIGQSQGDAFISAVKGKEDATNESEILENKRVLQQTFTKLIKSSQEDIAAATKELLEEAKKGSDFAGGIPEAKEISELIPILNSQFPDDIGLFVMFFLNYVKLEPGEAMFLKADDIHAYISGGT
jgi:mannose-6-phosphate isomerase